MGHAPSVTGAVESLPKTNKGPSSPFIVMRAGLPLGGQELSDRRATAHCAPIKAFLSASCRRNVAQLRKFPSQSVDAQSELIVAFVVVTTKRVLPAVAS